jgi:NAD-reducing hydrogenase large subunit
MNSAVNHVAKAFVNGQQLTEGVLNRVEAAIRCYDPCLSCSTHAVGKMPLEICLVASDGRLLDRIDR